VADFKIDLSHVLHLLSSMFCILYEDSYRRFILVIFLAIVQLTLMGKILVVEIERFVVGFDIPDIC
jgi:hypothetical protein